MAVYLGLTCFIVVGLAEGLITCNVAFEQVILMYIICAPLIQHFPGR